MSQKARNWAAAAASIALLAGGALAYGQVSGTFAIFTAETENPNSTFNGSWIPAPSAASSSLNGSPYSQEHLAWTSGNSTAMPGAAPNPVTGQTIYYADGGTGGSASCGSYGAFSTTTAAATTADLTGTQLSHWWCFEVFSTSAGANTSGNWTSDVATFTARRLFLPTAISLNNAAGQTVGTMEAGDTIVITYNQNISFSGTVSVLSCTAGTVLIGAAACGNTPTIGTITGLAIAHSRTFASSTTAGNGTTTLTITLVGSASTTTVTGGGTFTTTGTGVTSSGAQNACTANPTCSVSASGDF